MEGLRTSLWLGATRPLFEVSYESEMELSDIASLKIHEEIMRTLF